MFLFSFKPLRENANVKEKVLFFARTNYNRLCFVSHALSCFSMLSYTLTHYDDFEVVSNTLTTSLFMILIGFSKGFGIFLRRDEIWNIFPELEVMQQRRVGLNKKYSIKNYLDDYHGHIKVFLFPCVSSFFQLLVPFFVYFIYGTMELPFPYWFPFDVYCQGVFPFVLTWTTFVAFNTDVFLMSADSFLYGLLTVIAMEFHVIKIDLMDIGLVPEIEKPKRAKILIDHHNQLLNVCDKMQEIFAPIYLIIVTMSSLMFCSILFQLSIIGINVAAMAFLVTFMGIIGGQSLLLCLYGQKLIDASESLSEGVYNCGWEEFTDEKFKKQLVLMILRSQKAKRLSAMNFANISLENFTTVSYFIT